MKKLFGLLSLLGLLLFVQSNSFAGIPINEVHKVSKAESETTSVSKQKVTKKGSWLKRLTNKLAPAREGFALAIALTILIPFLGIAVWQDAVTKDFWITLLLTILLYIPGLIYAMSIILHDAR